MALSWTNSLLGSWTVIVEKGRARLTPVDGRNNASSEFRPRGSFFVVRHFSASNSARERVSVPFLARVACAPKGSKGPWLVVDDLETAAARRRAPSRSDRSAGGPSMQERSGPRRS